MIDLLIREARLIDSATSELVDIHCDGGVIVGVQPTTSEAVAARTVIDARGALAAPPYVEPHVHLDTALTAGEPRWNLSGTLCGRYYFNAARFHRIGESALGFKIEMFLSA